MKKVISIVLSVVMLLSLVPVTAYADDATPEIHTNTLTATISSGKTTATVGDTVTISVKITGDNITNLATLLLREPGASSNTTKIMNYNESTDRFETAITIESTTTNGKWQVYSISCTDKKFKRAVIYNNNVAADEPKANLSSGDFTVSGTGVDTIGPTIDASSLTKSISDGKEVASVGDGVTLSLKVTDSSGVSSVKINYIAPDATTAQYDFEYNSTTSKYEEIIVIEPAMAAGDWRVVSIEAADVYNNKTTLLNANTSSDYTADLSAANFTIGGATEDKTPPEVVANSFGASISSGNEKAVAGDTVTVSAKITDDSEIKSVLIVLQNPEGKLADAQTMKYNSQTDKYEAVIEITSDTEIGVWKISNIYAIDEEFNYTRLHNSKVSESLPSTDMSGGDFEVAKNDVTPHTHDYKVVATVDATCTQAGSVTYKCECGDSYTTETAAALGHSLGDWSVTSYAVAATCTANGRTAVETRKCTRCDYTETRGGDAVAAFGHYAVVDKAVAPTFKAAGKTAGKHCARCGAVIVAQKKVAKLGAPALSKVTAGKKQFKATWKAVKNIDGYQIQYSTNSKFKSGNKTVTVKGSKSASKTVKKLKAKKKYYVRIRAYKTINGKKQYSAWSKAKTVTTKK